MVVLVCLTLTGCGLETLLAVGGTLGTVGLTYLIMDHETDRAIGATTKALGGKRTIGDLSPAAQKDLMERAKKDCLAGKVKGKSWCYKKTPPSASIQGETG